MFGIYCEQTPCLNVPKSSAFGDQEMELRASKFPDTLSLAQECRVLTHHRALSVEWSVRFAMVWSRAIRFRRDCQELRELIEVRLAARTCFTIGRKKSW